MKSFSTCANLNIIIRVCSLGYSMCITMGKCLFRGGFGMFSPKKILKDLQHPKDLTNLLWHQHLRTSVYFSRCIKCYNCFNGIPVVNSLFFTAKVIFMLNTFLSFLMMAEIWLKHNVKCGFYFYRSCLVRMFSLKGYPKLTGVHTHTSGNGLCANSEMQRKCRVRSRWHYLCFSATEINTLSLRKS